MNLFKVATITAILLSAVSAAHAGIILNLNAGSSTPNAGNNSPGFAYNPVTTTLGAGTYTVGVVGIGGGGIYDGYSVYAPTASNGAYTDGNWSMSINGVVQTLPSTKRFDTAAAAASYYGGLAPLTFTLTDKTLLSFFVDDTSYPYFADDSGGVSLAITQVPEPVSLALLGSGIIALGLARHRRRRSTVA